MIHPAIKKDFQKVSLKINNLPAHVLVVNVDLDFFLDNNPHLQNLKFQRKNIFYNISNSRS
jgi:hypothetical protein